MKARLPRSFTFRLALTYLSLFGLSVLLLMLFIYWSTAAYMARQSDALIESEIDGLAEHYKLSGLDGLTSLITERLSRQPTGLSIYLLTTDNYTRLLGNLNRWPTEAEDASGWISFRLGNAAGDASAVHEARARRFALPGGLHLLVGRDIEPLIAAKERIVLALVWGLGLMLVLGGIGGWWMSRRMARRIETINLASREIMSGDLYRRIPLQGTDDELDRLAGNLNRMLDRIQALMEDVRRVSDNIAHDLRTPLGRLYNQLDSLRTEVKLAGLDTTGVEQALRESEGLLSTFNALLRIARIEASGRVEGFAPVDLADLARDVAEYYEPLAEARGQRLTVQTVPGVQIPGDRDLLFQALAYLLDNAIKYTPPGGQVTVEWELQDATIVLRVKDTGIGIAADDQSRIFERFFRVDKARSREIGGTGLGLSIVKHLCQAFGGSVDLQSTSGQGSIFTVKLPVSDAVEPAVGAGR